MWRFTCTDRIWNIKFGGVPDGFERIQPDSKHHYNELPLHAVIMCNYEHDCNKCMQIMYDKL